MCITIDELYAMKEQYLSELRAVEAKIAVVGDLIAVASAKVEVKSEEPEVEAELVETTVEENSVIGY
jgi:hypothetical protein